MHPRTMYYLFVALTTMGMLGIATTYVPFLLSIGLPVSDVALLNVFFWATIILLELPTGMLADGKSRAWSLKMGVLIKIFGNLIYALSNGFWSALLAEVLEGIGFAFISGALQAWITDALTHRNEKDQLRHVFATGAIVRGVSGLFGGLISALVGLYSLRFGWVVNALFLSSMLGILRFWMKDEGEPRNRESELSAFRKSWAVLKAKPSLQWVTVAAVTFGLVVSFNHYWAPIFRARLSPEKIALVWLPLYSSVAISGWVIRRISTVVRNEFYLIICAVILTGLGLIGISVCDGVFVAVAFVMVHEAGRGAFEPLSDAFTNKRIESGYRATFGSLQSLIGRSGYMITLLGIWIFTFGKEGNIPLMLSVLLVCGVLLIVAAGTLWFFKPKIRA